MSMQDRYETFTGEGLKTGAENVLHLLGGSALGRGVIDTYAFGLGGRIEDPLLRISVAGIDFENPVLVGAGWDKKGRAIHGLHALGFAGVEVGTVLPFFQAGNPQPRLWTIDDKHSVGLNRLGFNSPGMEAVYGNLSAAGTLPCPIGINVGRNKIMPNDLANWAHTQVIGKLAEFASYVTLGISSPNTPDLRGLQDKGPFRDLLQGAQAAIAHTGRQIPLFAKIDSERTEVELDDMIEVALEEGLAGFVATNTYSGGGLKSKYGTRWGNEMGGLSGADPEYRARATATVKRIYERAGDKLAIVGVGGVDSAAAAREKLAAGASAVQVVTAIRPSRGRVAAKINFGLLRSLQADGVHGVRDIVGSATKRGVLPRVA